MPIMLAFIAGVFPWLTFLATWGVLAAAAFVHFRMPAERRVRYFSILGAGGLGFRALYALAGTWGQHLIWSADPVARATFLDPSYFFPYVLTRFWLNVGLSLAMAGAFYLILSSLRRYRGRFFDDGEVELGAVLALAVGWPISPVFIGLVFLLVVAISLIRRAFLGEAYTTLGLPFLLAALACLIVGSILLHNIGWDYLKI